MWVYKFKPTADTKIVVNASGVKGETCTAQLPEDIVATGYYAGLRRNYVSTNYYSLSGLGALMDNQRPMQGNTMSCEYGKSLLFLVKNEKPTLVDSNLKASGSNSVYCEARQLEALTLNGTPYQYNNQYYVYRWTPSFADDYASDNYRLPAVFNYQRQTYDASDNATNEPEFFTLTMHVENQYGLNNVEILFPGELHTDDATRTHLISAGHWGYGSTSVVLNLKNATNEPRQIWTLGQSSLSGAQIHHLYVGEGAITDNATAQKFVEFWAYRGANGEPGYDENVTWLQNFYAQSFTQMPVLYQCRTAENTTDSNVSYYPYVGGIEFVLEKADGTTVTLNPEVLTNDSEPGVSYLYWNPTKQELADLGVLTTVKGAPTGRATLYVRYKDSYIDSHFVQVYFGGLEATNFYFQDHGSIGYTNDDYFNCDYYDLSEFTTGEPFSIRLDDTNYVDKDYNSTDTERVDHYTSFSYEVLNAKTNAKLFGATVNQQESEDDGWGGRLKYYYEVKFTPNQMQQIANAKRVKIMITKIVRSGRQSITFRTTIADPETDKASGHLILPPGADLYVSDDCQNWEKVTTSLTLYSTKPVYVYYVPHRNGYYYCAPEVLWDDGTKYQTEYQEINPCYSISAKNILGDNIKVTRDGTAYTVYQITLMDCLYDTYQGTDTCTTGRYRIHFPESK